MAHVPVVPIGKIREAVVDQATFEREVAGHQPLVSRLEERRAEVHAGWGEKYVDRVHEKDKLTTRERLDRLKDAGSEIFEVGTFVNFGVDFDGLRSPAAGVVTAFVQVEGRWCVVIANDNTVASGAWWPKTPEKIERAQEIARRLRLPALYLVDCSGLYLPEQRESFAGATGAGHIFKMNSLLSAEGVPQIAGVFGDCIAGGGYMPIISDRVYMTEQAYMVIAGAALIKGAKSQHITSLDIGGPEVHVHQSGCADERVPDDITLIECLRREVSRLPSSGAAFYRGGVESMEPVHSPAELPGLVPVDHRQAYDATEILARLCDQSLFWEVLPSVGREMICGVARVGGLYAGFVLNRQGLIDDPEARDEHARRAFSIGKASPRSARSVERATATAFPSSGCKTSAASTSAPRPNGTGSSPTGRTSSTPTAPTRRRCSRCCFERHRAPDTTQWRGFRTTRSCSSRLRFRGSASWKGALWPSRRTTASSTTTSRS